MENEAEAVKEREASVARVVLVNEESNGIHRTVTATFTQREGLEIEVHDLGEGASLFDDEYECWYRVSAAQLPAFCERVGIDPKRPLAGLKKKYSRDEFSVLVSLIRESELVRFSSHW